MVVDCLRQVISALQVEPIVELLRADGDGGLLIVVLVLEKESLRAMESSRGEGEGLPPPAKLERGELEDEAVSGVSSSEDREPRVVGVTMTLSLEDLRGEENIMTAARIGCKLEQVKKAGD